MNHVIPPRFGGFGSSAWFYVCLSMIHGADVVADGRICLSEDAEDERLDTAERAEARDERAHLPRPHTTTGIPRGPLGARWGPREE